MEQYFIIRNSNGDTYVESVSKDELLKRLKDEDYGRNAVFLDGMPSDRDTNYWGEDILIIKGKIVCPVEEKIVTQYKID